MTITCQYFPLRLIYRYLLITHIQLLWFVQFSHKWAASAAIAIAITNKFYSFTMRQFDVASKIIASMPKNELISGRSSIRSSSSFVSSLYTIIIIDWCCKRATYLRIRVTYFSHNFCLNVFPLSTVVFCFFFLYCTCTRLNSVFHYNYGWRDAFRAQHKTRPICTK